MLRQLDFPGVARWTAASFSIGTRVYIGVGSDPSDFPLRDFWEWDQITNVWRRRADFPGNSTDGVVSFSIGTKGYIGTGQNLGTERFTNEFWEYDPATNSWTQKASLQITPARTFAVGFSIGTKGYVGLGIKDGSTAGGSPGYYQDFWEWDQSTNVWTKKVDFPGNARTGAVGFSIGSKGYIGTGGDGSSYSKDFWEWDQATNLWTRKADFGGGARSSAVGVSIGNKAYIGTGNGGSIIYAYQDFWEYDPNLK
jgi:N-acetylneuraminic acid mutarotase